MKIIQQKARPRRPIVGILKIAALLVLVVVAVCVAHRLGML